MPGLFPQVSSDSGALTEAKYGAIRFVKEQQNEDGGYSFARGMGSNLQDTYFGLAVLELLDEPFPRVRDTVDWLEGLSPDGLYPHYYLAKCMRMLGRSAHDGLESFLAPRIVLDLPDAYIGLPSEFQPVSMVFELAKMIGSEIEVGEAAAWLFSYRNGDGGFGAYGRSRLSCTYYALRSLSELGYPLTRLGETLAFVKSCEMPGGHFVEVPGSFSAFLDHIRFGVGALSLLGGEVGDPGAVASLVLGFRNQNGGFARSFFGISTLEDTFYAASVLKELGSF